MSPRPAEPLTPERVFRAALDIVDRDGLEALTMRRLGRELDVEAMSLYYHVPNKAAVLQGVSDLVLAEFASDPPGTDWLSRLGNWCRAGWKALQDHPNTLPLLSVTPGGGAAREGAEVVLGLLAEGGLPPVEAHRAYRLIQAFAFGHVLMARARPDDEEIRTLGAELLAAEGAFPLLAEVLRDPRNLDPQEDFEAGLALLLDGIERAAAVSRLPHPS